MIEIRHKLLNETIEIGRIIGRYSTGNAGPTLIFLCGTHGNETSGIFGFRKVLQKLEQLQIPIQGELIAAFAGNLKALQNGVRFIDKDMNRIWITPRLKKLGFMDENHEPSGHEKKESAELLELFRQTIGRAKGEVYVFDLHTTSSISPPFTAISDTIRNRNIALKFPLPCVVGFDEQTIGTFMDFVGEMGIMGVAFEAGEHWALSSIENNISFIWLTLWIMKCANRKDIPDFKLHYKKLEKWDYGKHKIFDLAYHYQIKKGENFEMLPGFATFDKIKKNQHIANNRYGPVYAQESGRIFMPLYQKQGIDGYFIVREKSRRWLKLSEQLRRMRADRLLTYLPGIDRHPQDKHTLITTEKIYKRFRNQFHLLGYRREHPEKDKLLVSRNPYDIDFPNLESLAEVVKADERRLLSELTEAGG